MSKRVQRTRLETNELPGMARFQFPVELEYDKFNGETP